MVYGGGFGGGPYGTAYYESQRRYEKWVEEEMLMRSYHQAQAAMSTPPEKVKRKNKPNKLLLLAE